MVGFKSFADKVTLDFDSGITAIVGPNGCGKSNVADAVRWVLGEQSSKILRGTCMQDVIFKGTEKRKGLSFCEVSLYFDNSNKLFNTDYEEFVITRKLYKSGDSEYLLNNAPCRLKDVIDILHDSGVGKTGYSIIGQGMVEKIINSKPEDRRVIFEDAAGIGKFKFKKVEAERRLERTQDNLNQINLIISEIDRQLGPLKKQSETAKIYLELKEKLKNLEINAYIYQYDYASVNKEQINEKIKAITEELDFVQNKLNQANEKYNFAYDSVNTMDLKIAELREAITELRVNIEKRMGETNVTKEKFIYLKNENAKLLEEKRITEEKISQDEKDLFNCTNTLKNKNDLLIENNHYLNDLEEKYNKISNELVIGENETKDSQRKLYESLSKLGDIKAQISALKTEKTNYTTSIEVLESDESEIKQKLFEVKKAESESYVNVTNLTEKVNKTNIELHNLMIEQNEKNIEIKELEQNLNSVNSNIVTTENRIKMLDEMVKEYEGFNGSVKRLLNDVAKNNTLKDSIVGVVASLIKVPQMYQSAIEMALGSAVQNIVTTDDQSAKYLINYLKQKEYGRVTFLPINTVKPRCFDKSFEKLLQSEGCYGIASDLIKYDKNISNIISSLLGTTVVVNEINNALKLAKMSNFSFRIVTLDGDIISPQGSITGGSKKSQIANLLSRDTNIENAKNIYSKLLSDKEHLQKNYEKMADLISNVNNDVLILSNRLKEIEIELAREKEVNNNHKEICKNYESEQLKLSSNIAKNKQMIESINNELKKIDSEENKFEYTDNIDKSVDKFQTLRIERDQKSKDLTDLKIKVVGVENDIFALNQEKVRFTDNINSNKFKLSQIEKELDLNSSMLENAENIVSATDDEKSSSEHNMLVETKKQLETIESERNEHQMSLKSLDDDRMRFTEEIHKLQDKKYQQDLNLNKIDTDIEALQERVWTEYEITYANAQDYKQEMFDLKLGLQEIAKLKKDINALGNINVNAIEDCKLLEERHGNLYGQAQDLLKAESDLKKIIKDLSEEMKVRFETEFKKINANFGVVFKELFGGGTAKLQLIDSEDSLEAGVDIVAEPPEKKLSNISLLSGGEKSLVAIAIMFAILRLKPMPFCLLDEIEAALDEANVNRFASYLRRYSNETQFIVITHKKVTMENADVLFGVTMEEKGVSKIVSVKFSDAIKNNEVS